MFVTYERCLATMTMLQSVLSRDVASRSSFCIPGALSCYTIEITHSHLVSTPIGCVQDLSQRAVTVLSEVDLIAAEDTRTTQFLLSQ